MHHFSLFIYLLLLLVFIIVYIIICHYYLLLNMDINYLQLATRKIPSLCTRCVLKKSSFPPIWKSQCVRVQPSKNFSLNEKAACCITKFGAWILANMHRRPLACVMYLLLNKGGPDLARKFQFYRNKFRRELELCGGN